MSDLKKGEFPLLGRRPEDYLKNGLKRQVEPWEDGIRMPLERGTFEWWYFDARFDDGTAAVIVFFTKFYENIDEDAAPYVEVRVAFPDGKSFMGKEHSKNGEFRASREKCDVTVGKSRVEGDLRNYRIHTETEGILCDLNYENTAPPWRPGTGIWYFTEDRYTGWVVPVPSGRVTGKIVIDGMERTVVGSGYHDHNYGNIMLSAVANHWWWARFEAGGYTNIAADIIATEQYGYARLPVFLLVKDHEIVAEDESRMTFTEYEREVHPLSAKKIANKVRFAYRDGDTGVTVTYRRERDIKISDNLENISEGKRLLARKAGIRSWYHRFKGPVTVDIERSGNREHYEGEGIYELQHLGKDK